MKGGACGEGGEGGPSARCLRTSLSYRSFLLLMAGLCDPSCPPNSIRQSSFASLSPPPPPPLLPPPPPPPPLQPLQYCDLVIIAQICRAQVYCTLLLGVSGIFLPTKLHSLSSQIAPLIISALTTALSCPPIEYGGKRYTISPPNFLAAASF